jgi:hypothetical protein
MVPSVASGLTPNVIAHDPVPVDESVHRPAKPVGGGMARGPLAGAAGIADPAGAPLFMPRRSLSLQAASNALQTRTEMVAKRAAMKQGTEGLRSDDYG